MGEPVSQRHANGLDRPRYFDRQLLVAEDLTLEQGFADHRLALLARHALGWGVAAGLRLGTVPESQAGTEPGDVALLVSAGLALTPNGEAVYLSHEVVFEGIAGLVIEACSDAVDCGAVDAAASDDTGDTPRVAWVVAKKADLSGGPRAAMPEGCGHPGNAMRPSRCCGGVTVEVLCSLPPPHSGPPPEVDALHEDVCGPWGPALPPEVPPEADLVVLGALEVRPEGVFATPRHRRLVPRLDRLGHLVCPRPGTPIKYVTHIRPDTADRNRAIDVLAGFDERGETFVETLNEAVAGVEAGVTYRTLTPTTPGRDIRVRTRRGTTYLQTEGDARPPNNLESLPGIRGTST